MSISARVIRPLTSNIVRVLPCTATHLHQHRRINAYHSDSYPEPPSYAPAETAILSAALSRVPAHGFTQRSLQLGAQDAGYLSISTNLLPRGVFELVLYHLVRQRETLQDVVNTEALTGEGRPLKEIWEERKIGVGGRVRGLVLERLKGNVESGVVGRWQEVCTSIAIGLYGPYINTGIGARNNGPTNLHPTLYHRTVETRRRDMVPIWRHRARYELVHETRLIKCYIRCYGGVSDPGPKYRVQGYDKVS
jgi:hypothetical protein